MQNRHQSTKFCQNSHSIIYQQHKAHKHLQIIIKLSLIYTQNFPTYLEF